MDKVLVVDQTDVVLLGNAVPSHHSTISKRLLDQESLVGRTDVDQSETTDMESAVVQMDAVLCRLGNRLNVQLNRFFIIFIDVSNKSFSKMYLNFILELKLKLNF